MPTEFDKKRDDVATEPKLPDTWLKAEQRPGTESRRADLVQIGGAVVWKK